MTNVVASKVRALAQRSAEAVKEIKTLSAASGAQVESGVKLVNETGEALSQIVEVVNRLNALAGQNRTLDFRRGWSTADERLWAAEASKEAYGTRSQSISRGQFVVNIGEVPRLCLR